MANVLLRLKQTSVPPARTNSSIARTRASLAAARSCGGRVSLGRPA